MKPLSPLIVEPVVRAALLEDLGRAGDITTDTVVPAARRAAVRLTARDAGVVAGTDLAAAAFRLVDPAVAVEVTLPDGARVRPGDVVATVSGPARAILTAERVALNFLGHLSGVATATAQIADAVAHTATRVTCTRKTTPGLRALEKHAVVAGGGVNHRFGLDDAVLIKDNHIALAGGVRQAIAGARAGVGHLVKIEVEVDTLDQLREVLTDPVDAVLLDNMAPEALREAVELVAGRMVTEASGRLTVATAPVVAATGVDLMSAGWITHSAPVLDVGLDVAD
ncbi:carboxylating nicotinate-nucleotide diphosphorylase [Georgenia ruanii]|uniref:Nicotinate-nucleotide pyrophosphorylase [carboxylating] n=1 Tax=Georgenia ruanii TaxID=348442 RepID=A0A7J9V1I5_9MICO|nr:carboxylating nicotinate-nucleotide diphosphorylase [Georgenia ruanii]MPV90542.1 carboxylating nicotinate-nucleotide diphosphorylase [Georgenia ruanii]